MLSATVLISAAVVVILSAFVATAQVPVLAGVAELKDASGKNVGRATFIANLPEGGVWIQVQAEGLAPGVHGIHIHAVGVCSPPDFMTAGDHFNPENRKHGFLHPEGVHAGDLPNIIVGPSGRARYETANHRVTLAPGPNSLFDADGSALIIHAAADDYMTDPAGNTGARQVCGIVMRRDTPVTQIERRDPPL